MMGHGLRTGSNGHQTSPHIQPHLASPFMSSYGQGFGLHSGAPWASSVACPGGYGMGDTNYASDGSGFSGMNGCKYEIYGDKSIFQCTNSKDKLN